MFNRKYTVSMPLIATLTDIQKLAPLNKKNSKVTKISTKFATISTTGLKFWARQQQSLNEHYPGYSNYEKIKLYVKNIEYHKVNKVTGKNTKYWIIPTLNNPS